jgi:hypothetical protein
MDQNGTTLRYEPIETSPQLLARLGGVLYLAIIAIGLFAQLLVRNRILVAGDAVATAANLRAHEALWRWGIAAELLGMICVVVLLLVWYVLLSPVSPQLTWLALFFDLVAHSVQVAALLDLVAALFPLGGAAYLEAFTPEQLAALARMAGRAHAHGFGVSLLFSGCFFLVAGYLIRKSGYLPRPIGALYQFAGVGYIANTLVLVVAPAWSGRIMIAVAPVILPAEVALAIWLLVKGIDPERWNRRQLGARGPEETTVAVPARELHQP